MEEAKKKTPKKYRFVGRPKGAKSEDVRTKHPIIGWIYEDQLTEDMVSKLKLIDEKNGIEFCNSIK